MSIVTDIDAFIVDRLKLIAIDSVPLPVLPYIPSRERGENEFPCASVTRVGFQPDKNRSRFGIEVFRPKTTKKVIQLGNGNVRVVPDGYEVRQYPGAYILRYIIDTEAVKKAHADALFVMMEQAFPFGYEPRISGQYILFNFTEPIVKDDLSRSLFKVSYLFDTYGVHVDKLEHYEVSGISEQLFDIPSEFYRYTDGPWGRQAV